MTDILMPALSPTMEEGTVAKWLVKLGDKVEAGQVIAEIETDKATMEVEAGDEGVVSEILVEAGTEGVKVNAPIARLSGDDETPVAPTAHARGATGAEPPSPSEPTGPSPAPAAAEPPPGAPSQSAGETGQSHAAPVQVAVGERVPASPLARRLAQAAGIDLKSLKGSGPHGRIIKRDVDAARGQAPLTQAAQPAAVAQSAAVSPPQPQPGPAQAESRAPRTLEQMGVAPGSYTLVPLDGMRRTIVRRMSDSFRDVPHFPLNIDLEIDRLLEARARINGMLEKQGVKVSVNDLVIKAVAVALTQVPEANASYSPEGIALHQHADIAMAVALDAEPGGLSGLITPIIRAAETKGVAQIAREAKDLAARARAKKLKPEEYQGGTFSISNLGMFGIKSFNSIINEPQGCIMSVGAGTPQPVVKGGQLAVATVMSVTLTCDHRVVDGATGAKFLQAFKGLLEDPLTMIV
jgi:pyruvate dehydrogenase E2 component (dihydrolipoamide acetyltransferase)